MYKGLRTLQAASLTFWFSGAGTLSVGFVALSRRVTAVHYLKQIKVLLHFTFVLRLSRLKKAHEKEEPAGARVSVMVKLAEPGSANSTVDPLIKTDSFIREVYR